MAADPRALLARLGRPHITVIGDIILDRYVLGHAERLSPEAPVPVLRVVRRVDRLGGAAGVASMLAALEVPVRLLGVLGNDAAASNVRHLLAKSGVDGELILGDDTRATTVKERFIGLAQDRHPQQLVRVDSEFDGDISPALESTLIERLIDCSSSDDVLLISDYAKGVCTLNVLRQSIDRWAAAMKKVLIDPSRRGNYERYRGCTCLTPNRSEARTATGIAIDSIDAAYLAARQLEGLLDAEAIVLKLDSDGMVLAHRDEGDCHFSTRAREVYDVTGAGDMVLAMLGLCLGSGFNYTDALPLANYAAGIEVEQLGAVALSREQLVSASNGFRLARDKLGSCEQLIEVIAERRRNGECVVFTNGCFDIFHAGHVNCLQSARLLGDVLVVGLNSDQSVRRLKGEGRPIHPEAHRVAVLGALECVDYIVVFDSDTPLDVIAALHPDVLVKGGDYDPNRIVGREIVEKYGGKVITFPLVEGLSSSRIIDQLED